MVMSYLTFRNVVNCLRVSRGWKTYLTKCPNLWLDLDLSGARRDVSRVFIRNAVKYSNYRIQRAIIHRFRHLDDLRNIATVCKDLTHVEFLSGTPFAETLIEIAQCAQNLKSVVLHTEVSLSTILDVLRFRPTLERAQFMSIISTNSTVNDRVPFPDLRTLELNRTRGDDRPFLLDLLKQTPGLTSLKVTNLCSSSMMIMPFVGQLPLIELALRNSGHHMFPKLPPTLEKLIVESSTPLYIPHVQGNGQPLIHEFSWKYAAQSYVPKLSSLQLANCENLNAAFFSVLLDQHFDVHDMAVSHSDDPEKSAPLRHIWIKDSAFATELPGSRTLGELLRSSPRLLSRNLQTLYV
jgi:F-box/TPR repeat protein Pof3